MPNLGYLAPEALGQSGIVGRLAQDSHRYAVLSFQTAASLNGELLQISGQASPQTRTESLIIAPLNESLAQNLVYG
jgi:hypothetical protein